jgi:hypothetical protein
VILFLSVLQPNRDAETFSRTLVVVLGMHRSGTSCVAGTLVRLGAAAPEHLIAPNPGNERGFWESRVIVDLNDAILAAGESHWRDWRKFNLEAIGGVKAEAFRARAKTALAEEFGDVGLAVMKDPRICRLMPFWRPVFEEAGWSVRAVLPIRSPLEVAWSLNRRDGLRLAYGLLLWLRHVLDAEAETRGMARAITNWPRFLDDPRKALAQVSEQVGLIWPDWHERALAEVDEYVSPNLRRQRASDEDLRTHSAVNDLVRQTYSAMTDLVRDPDDSHALAKLDELRATFETASAIFDCPMRDLDDEIRRIRAQAAVEIGQAETTIARIAGQSRDSTKPWTGLFRKPRSIARTRPSPNAKDLDAIRNSLFFNPAHYLETNPDVRSAGMDAAFHYLVYGGREGRDPGPFFSTKAYLARYPDVAETGFNALLHYETRGRRENRIAAA